MKRVTIAFLAVALFAGVPTAHAGDGVKALSLLPADTTIVLNINFKRLRKSSSYGDILSAAKARPDYKEGVADLKKAGIDLEKDVDTLMLGVRGDANGGDADGVVLIAEGRFNPKRLIKVLRKKNSDMKTRQHKGVKYYTLDDDGSLAILGRRVILAENKRMPSVIDLHKGRGSSVAGDRGFRKLRARIDTAKDVWFVAEIPKSKRAGFGVPMAENIEAFSGSLDLRRGLGVRLRISSTDAASANQLVAMVKMGLSMAGSDQTAKSMGLDKIAQKAVVITDEADMVLKLDLTKAEAAKLKTIAEMAGGAM